MSESLRRALLAKMNKSDSLIQSKRSTNDSTNPISLNNTCPGNLPSWQEFFTQNEQFFINNGSYRFNTYFSLPEPELLLKASKSQSIPIFIFHHGAGSSALSFAPLAQSLQEKLENLCGTFAFDARGHGLTETPDTATFRLGDFVSDFCQILDLFYSRFLRNRFSDRTFSLVLVGHSLGGSICSSAFHEINDQLRQRIVGVAMLDIVEEAAKKALNTVDTFLTKTPNLFPDYTAAIDWHVQKGLSRLKTSAQISIPSLFTPTASGKVVRRTNLQIFRPFWDSWFTGLSSKFVALPTSKLLVLAGDDNLDRELIIGQMQGKFQLVVFQDSGHFIEEDCPSKTAITLIDFWRRNDTKNLVIKTNWTKNGSPISLN
ncbi:LAME_0E12838g1_1 [Lachancea meyersii CBS 8951]|uniref:Protein phosphatase methylesterase 1 n=1 Tax=Lachancea meyersii CBS 8951 TaxID=1266667 RepID=A0A1G4JM34_9SACH|nr:LAME_0E12838g1_1 [Lachancea meyersii CBS 8951]